MKRKNDLHPYMFEQSINTSVVVACLNDFCKNITKKTIVVMDNSSIHRSEEFEEYIPLWKKKGLMIKYLIQYAPELNPHRSPKFGGKSQIELSSGDERDTDHHHRARR